VKHFSFRAKLAGINSFRSYYAKIRSGASAIHLVCGTNIIFNTAMLMRRCTMLSAWQLPACLKNSTPGYGWKDGNAPETQESEGRQGQRAPGKTSLQTVKSFMQSIRSHEMIGTAGENNNHRLKSIKKITSLQIADRSLSNSDATGAPRRSG